MPLINYTCLHILVKVTSGAINVTEMRQAQEIIYYGNSVTGSHSYVWGPCHQFALQVILSIHHLPRQQTSIKQSAKYISHCDKRDDKILLMHSLNISAIMYQRKDKQKESSLFCIKMIGFCCSRISKCLIEYLMLLISIHASLKIDKNV